MGSVVAMQSLIEIIDENTGWEYSNLASFAELNQVDLRREGAIVLLNYRDNIKNEAWNDFNRQCRGIILDIEQRKVVAHPFDKFFNLESHPETMMENLPFASGYEIATKYDGTMITTFFYDGRERFATRFSFDNAQTRMAKRISGCRYPGLKEIDLTKYTLVFELISPQNRIIVEYEDEDMILIGVRNLLNNRMFSYAEVREFADKYGLRSITVHQVDFSSLVETAQDGVSESLEEGWVVRFSNGLYLKVKTWQYLAMFRIIRMGLTSSKLALRYYDSTPQDWKTFLERLPLTVRIPVERFGSDCQARLNSLSEKIHKLYRNFAHIENQKDFALTVQKQAPKYLHSFLFSLRSGKPIDRLMRKRLKEKVAVESATEVVSPLMIKEWAFRMMD